MAGLPADAIDQPALGPGQALFARSVSVTTTTASAASATAEQYERLGLPATDNDPDGLPGYIAAGLNGMPGLNPSAPLLEVFAAHPGVTPDMVLEIDAALSGHITRKMPR